MPEAPPSTPMTKILRGVDGIDYVDYVDSTKQLLVDNGIKVDELADMSVSDYMERGLTMVGPNRLIIKKAKRYAGNSQDEEASVGHSQSRAPRSNSAAAAKVAALVGAASVPLAMAAAELLLPSTLIRQMCMSQEVDTQK